MSLTTEFKVGIFTILGLSTLLGTAYMLETDMFFIRKNRFITILPNAAGVSPRTQVRVAGVQVGRVTKVIVEPDGAELQYEVTSSIDIPVDSHIEIKTRGMLGDMYVEIERGTSKQYLASGASIPIEGEAADIQKLIANISSIATDVKKITSTFSEALNGEGEYTLKAMIRNLETTAAHIADLVTKNDTKISNIIDNIDVFTTQLKNLSTDENRKKIADIIDNLDTSSVDLKKVLAKIESGEGTIGRLVERDDTVNEIQQTLSKIQSTVNPFAGLHVGLEDRFEYRYRNAEQGARLQNQFNVMFWTIPERYYLIGIVNGQYGRKVTQSSIVLDVNGNQTNIQDQKNTLENTWLWKWNIQVSQRLSLIGADFLGIRVGFFRSTPGFAVDIYVPTNMFVASAEFYDFDGFAMASDRTYGKRHVMNVKLYGNLYLTPHFYLTAGVTNLVLLDQPWPFFGAGLYFTDKDIRGLFTGSNQDDNKTQTEQKNNTHKTSSVPNEPPSPSLNLGPDQNLNPDQKTCPDPNIPPFLDLDKTSK